MEGIRTNKPVVSVTVERKTRYVQLTLLPNKAAKEKTHAMNNNQGDAGGMGSGEQFVAILPKDVWFRTSYSGRLYGAPGSHYYRWDGVNLSAMTWDERQTLEALVEDGAPLPITPPAPVIEARSPFSLGKLPTFSLFDEEDDEEPAKAPVVVAEAPKTVTISVELLNRLMAGNTDMDAVWEAAALLPKS